MAPFTLTRLFSFDKEGNKNTAAMIVKLNLLNHRRDRQRRLLRSYSSTAAQEGASEFTRQLHAMGLCLRDIKPDGNCLFRALADQLDGSDKNHARYRQQTVEHMLENRQEFMTFHDDEEAFNDYISVLAKPGTYAGNDAIVAFARRHEVHVVIHQLTAPVWKIPGTDKLTGTELHISYHNGDHYSSVRRIGDRSQAPTTINLQQPMYAYKYERKLSAAKKRSNSESDVEPSKDSAENNSERTVSVSSSCSCETNASDYGFGESTSDGEDKKQASERQLSDAEIIELIMEKSGCMERDMVQLSWEEHDYDFESTLSFLLQIKNVAHRRNQLISEDSISLLSNDSGISVTRGRCDSDSSCQLKKLEKNLSKKEKRILRQEKKAGRSASIVVTDFEDPWVVPAVQLCAV